MAAKTLLFGYLFFQLLVRKEKKYRHNTVIYQSRADIAVIPKNFEVYFVEYKIMFRVF